jgi:VanZ family protein
VTLLILEYWVPLLAWLITIFFFSTDAFSSGETSKIIVPILTFFFPHLSAHEINAWHDVIRKCAHIAEYFILAVLAYRTIRLDRPDLRRAKLKTAIFVLLAALLDEFHQRFTHSRGASIIDVGYDCLGAVSALLLITTYETGRLRSRSVL